jgi:hypothetical protein
MMLKLHLVVFAAFVVVVVDNDFSFHNFSCFSFNASNKLSKLSFTPSLIAQSPPVHLKQASAFIAFTSSQ